MTIESYYSRHFKYPTIRNDGKVEEFLVFKGSWVWYSSMKRKIKGDSEDGCILIKDVDPEQVKTDEARVIYWPDGEFLVEGNEIWSDGQHYIIKDRRGEPVEPQKRDEGTKYRCNLCGKIIKTEGVTRLELHRHLIEDHGHEIAPRLMEIAALAIAEKLTNYIESLFEEVRE